MFLLGPATARYSWSPTSGRLPTINRGGIEWRNYSALCESPKLPWASREWTILCLSINVRFTLLTFWSFFFFLRHRMQTDIKIGKQINAQQWGFKFLLWINWAVCSHSRTDKLVSLDHSSRSTHTLQSWFVIENFRDRDGHIAQLTVVKEEEIEQDAWRKSCEPVWLTDRGCFHWCGSPFLEQNGG